MNDLTHAQNILFEEWRKKPDLNGNKIRKFVVDGVIDQDVFKLQTKKILFILRDKNCSIRLEDADNKLACELNDHGSGWRTWNNVARWTSALIDESDYPYDISDKIRAEHMRKVVAMNLKKEAGTSRTNGDELEFATKSYWNEIYRQIEIYSPDIIICCGLSGKRMKSTYDLLRKYVLGGSNSFENCFEFNSSIVNHKWRYSIEVIGNKETPVIEFCHPQVTVFKGNRGHEQLFVPLYNDMKRIGIELLKKGAGTIST